MRRFFTAGALAALGVAALAIPASGAQLIDFHADAIHQGHSHFNQATHVLTFRNHLVSHFNHARHIGDTKGRCKIKSRAKAHCRVVYSFPNGKVKTDGRVFFRRNRDREPVIGGTRAFNGVAGKVIVSNERGHVTHLHFVLVK
jgi:hypothetical protein